MAFTEVPGNAVYQVTLAPGIDNGYRKAAVTPSAVRSADGCIETDVPGLGRAAAWQENQYSREACRPGQRHQAGIPVPGNTLAQTSAANTRTWRCRTACHCGALSVCFSRWHTSSGVTCR